jgi:hypothetical protein
VLINVIKKFVDVLVPWKPTGQNIGVLKRLNALKARQILKGMWRQEGGCAHDERVERFDFVDLDECDSPRMRV